MKESELIETLYAIGLTTNEVNALVARAAWESTSLITLVRNMILSGMKRIFP